MVDKDAANMESDLRSRVVALEHGAQSWEIRLVALEAWRTQRDIDSARHDERWIGMENRLTSIETEINGIQETLTWIMRIVIGGIIMGVIAFLMRGGFNIPT